MNYLEELFARIVQMQLAAISGSFAVPYFIYQQEAFPYFTNRLGDETEEFDSEDYIVRTYSVIMRYVVGHITEGQPGRPETRLYADIPTIEDYFIARPGFLATGYTTELRYLRADQMTFARSTGTRIFDNRGIGIVNQVGAEFTLTVPFHLPIDYASS